jgi:predicted kinase
MLNEAQTNKTSLKMIFLAGGPGSGKNYVAEQLFGIKKGSNFSADGLKLISFDSIFEAGLKQLGITPSQLATLAPEQKKQITDQHNQNSLYSKCRVILNHQLKTAVKSGVGIIFDGTGQNSVSYLDKKDVAEALGYDTYMVFVDSSLDSSLARNANRDRKLPDDLVAQIHRYVKGNKQTFEREFGNNMITIDNTDNGKLPPEAYAMGRKIINAPIKNKVGQYFIAHGTRPPIEPKQHTEKPVAPQLSWWNKFNNVAKDDSPYKDNPPPLGKSKPIPDVRIHNPDTGNDILLRTALGYPPGHPMHRKADQERKKYE